MSANAHAFHRRVDRAAHLALQLLEAHKSELELVLRDHRWRHGGLVVLHEGLAQRILALLDGPAMPEPKERYAVRDELRAIVERKP